MSIQYSANSKHAAAFLFRMAWILGISCARWWTWNFNPLQINHLHWYSFCFCYIWPKLEDQTKKELGNKLQWGVAFVRSDYLSRDLNITRWFGWHGTERKCRFQESSLTTSPPCQSGAPMLFKKRFHNSVPQMASSRGCPIILQFPGEAKIWRPRLRGFPTLQASCGGGVPAAGRLHDHLVCDRLVYRRRQPPGR